MAQGEAVGRTIGQSVSLGKSIEAEVKFDIAVLSVSRSFSRKCFSAVGIRVTELPPRREPAVFRIARGAH